MKNRDMANLLARAAAAIESPDSINDHERAELVEDLDVEASNLRNAASGNDPRHGGHGRSRVMMATQNESSALKAAFKNHFRDSGYDSALPAALATSRDRYPNEWAEACQEFERYGWDGVQ